MNYLENHFANHKPPRSDGILVGKAKVTEVNTKKSQDLSSSPSRSLSSNAVKGSRVNSAKEREAETNAKLTQKTVGSKAS